MKKIFVLVLSIIAVQIWSFAQIRLGSASKPNNEQSLSSQTLTNQQIHRIGDYGKLWCVLKLFHPEMAYDKINADSLFIDNIGDLLNEPTAENFKKSVQKMIDRIHDPSTKIVNNEQLNDSIKLPNRSLLKWLDDSIALVYFDKEFMRKNSGDNNNGALLSLLDTLNNAHGIIADFRKTGIHEYDYYQLGFLKHFISYVTSKNLNYPSIKSRIHYGHESETFDVPLSYQGWFLRNGDVIYKKRRPIQKPLCFLINRFTTDLGDVLAAMQQNGLATVIADDSFEHIEPQNDYVMRLSDGLKVNIKFTQVVYQNGKSVFTPDTIIYRKGIISDDSLIYTTVRLLKRDNESKHIFAREFETKFTPTKVEGYDSLSYPSAPLRLLGLMRYWSAINYFCPNKDRIVKNWDSVLYEYVPKLLYVKDSLHYMLTVARLITEIHDGHGSINSPRYSALHPKAPQIQLKYIENKTIVFKVLNDSLRKDISVGDEIVSVAGMPIKKYRDSIAQYIGASNDASLQRHVTNMMLRGKNNSVVTINLLHDGELKHESLHRNEDWRKVAFTPEEGAIWKKLKDRIGYVDLGRLQVVQIDSMFNDFKNTSTIIFDDRSYPQGTVSTLINYLTDKTVSPAKGTTMIADSPEPLSVQTQEQIWQIPVTPVSRLYKGNIVLLVNEETQSQAEYSCMVLQAASKKVTIIGSQTAGADGGVTGIKIPGGIQTAFSGNGVHYPDGRPTQGIGIVPDIKISPTIKGVKQGRDEVLERAIKFAVTGK